MTRKAVVSQLRQHEKYVQDLEPIAGTTKKSTETIDLPAKVNAERRHWEQERRPIPPH